MSRMSNYGSFAAGVVIRGVPLIQTHPGRVYWVYNGTTLDTGHKNGSNANKGTFEAPFATIDYAIGQCRADKGDIIFVKPGHSEVVTATSIAIDVAGIALIGLGQGSARPTLSYTATTGNIALSANNVLMHNFLFTGDVDAITALMTVSGADVVLSKLEMRDVTGQLIVGILTTAAANRLKILDFNYDGSDAAGSAGGAAIAIVGGDQIEIADFRIIGNFAVAGIDVRTTATTQFNVHDGHIWQQEGSVDTAIIDTITGSTGKIGPNITIQLSENAANITEAITGATWYYFGGGTAVANGTSLQVCNLAGEAAMVLNKVTSTDA